jgi:hypothetical protein
MKQLSCDLCDTIAQGETFHEWMQAIMPHYVEKHAEVMNDATKTDDDKKERMKVNNQRFEEAATI